MTIQNAANIYDKIFGRIEKFTSSRFWKIKSVLSLTILSLCFATPQIGGYEKTFKEIKGWQAFEQQKNNFLSQPDFDDNSNAAKKVFRLTVPLIAKIFHLNNYGVLILGCLLNILFFFFAIQLTEKITKDKVAALLLTVGLTFIYNGHSGFTDNNTWFDIYAYFFLLMAMYQSNVFMTFIWISLACWTDERAAVASLFVFAFWKISEMKNSMFDFKSLFKLGVNSSAVIISIIVFSATRYFISIEFNLHLPLKNVGLQTLFNSTNAMALGWWSALEGFWILVVICFYVLIRNRYLFSFSFLFMMIVLMMGIAFSVYDITRSAAYIFPVIFISVLVLNKYFSKNEFRKIVLIGAVICFLFPSYYFATESHVAAWYKPVFIKALEHF